MNSRELFTPGILQMCLSWSNAEKRCGKWSAGLIQTYQKYLLEVIVAKRRYLRTYQLQGITHCFIRNSVCLMGMFNKDTNNNHNFTCFIILSTLCLTLLWLRWRSDKLIREINAEKQLIPQVSCHSNSCLGFNVCVWQWGKATCVVKVLWLVPGQERHYISVLFLYHCIYKTILVAKATIWSQTLPVKFHLQKI